MGQITRLLASPTDSSGILGNTSLEPVLETILIELGMQDSIRSIRNATLINSGRTLRFVYTNDTIKDVDLPQSIQAVSIQQQGDNNILTIRGNDGSIVIYTIESNLISYNVVPADNTVEVTRTGDERNVVFNIKANIPTPNNGKLTLKQGNVVLGDFTANQEGNTEIQIPTTDGEDGQNGKSAYELWLEQGNVGSINDFLESLKGQDGQDGTNGTNGTNGADGQDGSDGADGQDGITPHIDPTSKHWMIGNTDTGVVAEGKDGKDGADGEDGTSADYEAYDMMVHNETEFLDAVARSHGWKNTFWNNNATHLITDTTSDPKTGITDPTTKPCLVRIHLASNIDSLDNRVIDLSHCEVYGHDFVLKITTKLHIVGMSAKFESVKFEHTSQLPDNYFYIEGQRNVSTFTHSKFRFTDCQFNNTNNAKPFIHFIRGSVSGRNTYSVYIKGFETHSSTYNKLIVDEDTSEGQTDGNHNLIIMNRYTSYAITVDMSSNTTQESRLLHDSSVIAGTVTGSNIIAQNIFSMT